MSGTEIDTRSTDTDARVAEIVRLIAAHYDLKIDIAPTDALVDRGMTSMAMVDLMLAIEATFEVTIPQRELTPANFQSIDSLSRLVARLESVSP